METQHIYYTRYTEGQAKVINQSSCLFNRKSHPVKLVIEVTLMVQIYRKEHDNVRILSLNLLKMLQIICVYLHMYIFFILPNMNRVLNMRADYVD